MAVGYALQAKNNILRLNAARLVADFPSAHLLPMLRSALTDELWTVRWDAVAAIAAIEPDEALLPVLLRTRPRDSSKVVAEQYRRALAVLGERGVSLPPEISAWMLPEGER